MKKPLIALTLLASLLTTSLLSGREWTNPRGGTYEAEIVSADEKVVILKAPDKDREMKIPFSRLNEEDQAYVLEWIADNPVVEEEDTSNQVVPEFKNQLVKVEDGKLVDYEIPNAAEKKFVVLYFPNVRIVRDDNKVALSTPDTFSAQLADFYSSTNADGTAPYELIMVSSSGKTEDVVDLAGFTGINFPVVKIAKRANINIVRRHSSEKLPYLVVIDGKGETVAASKEGNVEGFLSEMQGIVTE